MGLATFEHQLYTPALPGPFEAGAEWFALTVKPQHEKIAQHLLHSKGLDTLLPLYAVRHRWSDRFKEVHLPLFSRYVFCRFHRLERTAVLRTPGVCSVVGFGNGPTPIPAEEIAGIEAMMHSGRVLQPWPFLKTGQKVRIQEGPLRGVCGTLLTVGASPWVVVGVELLQRAVAAKIERDALTPE